MFMAKEDPLPKMAGVPWDDLPSTNIAFGVNALGEQVFFDIEDSPHLLVLGSSGSGKAQPLTARIPVPISERFPDGWALLRSEEHTSELQSRFDLVCRLL